MSILRETRHQALFYTTKSLQHLPGQVDSYFTRGEVKIYRSTANWLLNRSTQSQGTRK